MKRLIIVSLMLVLVMAGAAFAGVSGTPHQIVAGGEVCVGCHTPHGAVASTNGPLWNRSQDAQTYTPYASATFEMDAIAVSITAPQSIACLTCHNGVASNIVNAPGPGNVGGAAYNIAAGQIANWDASPNAFANIGTDLTNDHPIGFTYNPGIDSQLNTFPALVGAGNSKQVGATGMWVYSNTNADAMECATCHDVHNQAVPTQSPVYFLRMANTGSAMCLACHTAK